MRHHDIVQYVSALVIAITLLPKPILADVPPLTVMNPSNSGIPGEEVRVVRWGPDGKLWVAARWPFWQDGGIATYDFDTEVWSVWSKGETPLPSEYVNDIEFAADGAAWIATNLGVARFDGQAWTIYDPTNTPMTLYKVTDLSIAPDGHVWINNSDFNFAGDAIWEFDGVNWTPYRAGIELPWDTIWTDLADVFVASNGDVWVSNDTLPGVAHRHNGTWTFRGQNIGVFDGMTEDASGNVYIAPDFGQPTMAKWNGTTMTSINVGLYVLEVTAGPDGALYYGNWGGIVRRSTDGGQTWPILVSGLNHVYNIVLDPTSDDIWIGTQGALGQFRGDGSRIRDFNTWNSGIPDYFIDYMWTDRDGYFWVATGEAGLSRFDGLRWRNWGDHNVGSEPYPFAGNEPMAGLYQDHHGTHWMGGNGIARWDSESGQFTGFWNWQNNPGMGVTMFPFFAEDMNGNLFAASEYGSIFRFDEEVNRWIRETVQPYAVLGLPGMQADSQGNVWVPGWFDIYKWDGTAWSTVTLPYSDYFFDLGGINGFAVDLDDTLWLATESGLVHWDGTDFTIYDMSNTPLPTAAIKSVAIRDDGVMGLSASEFGASTPFPHGACVIDGPITDPASWTIYQYGTSPLPHYQLGAVQWDAQGTFWVSAISEGAALVNWPAHGLTGDLNGDGYVDIQDLAALLAVYATCEGDPAFDPAADLDHSGCIGLADLAALLANYGS